MAKKKPETDAPKSPTVGQMLASPSAAPEVLYEGQTYKMGYPTLDTEARLERLVLSHAWSELQQLKNEIDPELYADMVNDYKIAIRRGEHKIGVQKVDGRPGMASEIWDTPTGGMLFALALFREHHPDMTMEFCTELIQAEPEQVTMALEEIVPRFFQIVAARLRVPADKKNEIVEQCLARFRQRRSVGVSGQ